MRDILRNPILYYILAPVLIGVWPFYVWFVSLPNVKTGLDKDIGYYSDAKKCMDEIWTLDPERSNVSKSIVSGAFSYPEAVSRVADIYNILSRNYSVNASPKTKINGKEIQEAKVTLSGVDIVQACQFLSKIQSTWVNLECERVEIKKKGDEPDKWDFDLSFRYTYSSY